MPSPKKSMGHTAGAITLEEVFNETSTATSSNLNPPPSAVVLTPRSAEACLKLGVNPELLKVRDIDSFWEHGVEPAVQRLRHEAYIQRRNDLMKQCRAERRRIMNIELENAANLSKASVGLTPEQLIKQQEEATSSMIQAEMARIAKMQKRQEKELEQMIQFEVSRAKVQEEMAKRLEEEKRKDQMRKKKLEKRLKLMAEERRLREVQRATEEEIEEHNRRAVAKSMYEKEEALAEKAAIKAKEAKIKARENEIEQKRKHEEHKAATEKYFYEEEMRLRQRLESMNIAEVKKQEAIIQKQQVAAEKIRLRRQKIEERIEQNVTMARRNEEKRKNDFMEKQEHHEKIRAEHLRQQEEERRLHSQEIELQEQRRQMILLQQRREDDKKAEGLLVKFEEEEQHVEEVQQLRLREHFILNEKKNLRTQMKLENVERTQRIIDYKRISTLKKIEDQNSRIKTMMDQRENMILERRRAAAATKLQKEKIAEVMTEVRTNASKAAKLITAAMSGKVTLASLTEKKISSPGKKKSGKKRNAESTRTKLGLGTGTPSDGGGGGGGGGGDGEDVYGDDEFEDGDGGGVREETPQPKPYKSPYDS